MNTSKSPINSTASPSAITVSQASRTAGYSSNTVTINNIQLNTSITKEINGSMINAIAKSKKLHIDKTHKSIEKPVSNEIFDKSDKLCNSITEEDYGRRKTAASSIINKDEYHAMHVRHPSNPENGDILK